MSDLKTIIAAAAHIEPLTLAIVFTGLVSLSAIWLAALVIKTSNKRTKK